MNMLISQKFQAQNGKEGWGYEVLQNALPAVDTFFFMSGLLVCYLTLVAMEKGRFNIVLFYVHRIIRYLCLSINYYFI